MAKIIIAGDAVVIKSSLKAEDILKVQKFRPEELILMGGEDGKEPIFGLTVTKSGVGAISSIGASFPAETRDEEGLATMTMTPRVEGDLADWVVDSLGGAITNLEKLEAKIPGVIDEIEAQRTAIREGITVA